MEFVEERQEMIRVIKEEAAYTSVYTGKKSIDSQILQVMSEIPRHEFVPKAMHSYAYENGPLYIGCGQTISQPYIVALMTDLLSPKPEHTILDIGTGSGYQAAILSRLVKQVYGVEIVGTLAREAKTRLHRLGYDNIELKIGDGTQGWAQHSPFDGIIVAAATPFVPAKLVAQLKPGGKLVMPLGFSNKAQELIVIEKNEKGETDQRYVLPVVFVPLVADRE